MSKYIMRLDDACEKMDIDKWDRMEKLLDKYGVKPLVGVIPCCEDTEMAGYSKDANFWPKVSRWIDKGWEIALHGYNHVYSSKCSGINPVNKRSEFAGLDLKIQREKIRKGIEIFRDHKINPKVFYAPSHTFDENTISALLTESDIKIISDTPTNKSYSKYGMTFVPQQSGAVRKLPFSIITYCYHPNKMDEKDFDTLEDFLVKNKSKFIAFPVETTNRKMSIIDKIINKLYFVRRR